MKAALTQATELQAAMEEQQEEHAIELSEAQQQMSLLQQELSRKQEQCKDLCRQLDDACHAATR